MHSVSTLDDAKRDYIKLPKPWMARSLSDRDGGCVCGALPADTDPHYCAADYRDEFFCASGLPLVDDSSRPADDILRDFHGLP